MIENCPTCNPDAVFSVKQTCAELGICHKTLRKLRKRGIITPCNTNPRRYKYTGQSIIDCWRKATRL
ncbi:MAG: helix-turn-helix domain-containing protein [Muribaculaceae bacterium]|nr:helix-turn-helix domain-containing protein [Muribaculaceae bacterium]